MTGKLAKILRLVCSVAMAILIISFAVSNREKVAIELQPLPYSSQMPLYLFGLFALLLGFLWGSTHSLAERFNKHLQLKDQKRMIEALRAEVITLRAENRLADDKSSHQSFKAVTHSSAS